MAFSLPIPADVICASRLVTQNLGNRGDGSDGTKEQQFIGVLGENFIRHFCGLPYMEPKGFDGGYDVIILGNKFDVKTMGRTIEPRLDFVNNFVASQTKFDPDAYLFISINKTNFKATVCGWIEKQLFAQKANLFAKNTKRKRADGSSFVLKADTYEIENSKLHYQFSSFPELFSLIPKKDHR